MENFELYTSASPALRKTAEEKSSSVLRTHVRGGSILDEIIPPEDITKEQLDPVPDSIKPLRWEEMDSRSPGAMSMGFGGAAVNHYMHLRRYVWTFNRLKSHRITADVNDLMSYKGDIVQLFHDYMIKDLVDQRDIAFITTARAACGTKNDTSSTRASITGAVGYTDVGTVDRGAITAIGQALPDTVNSLPAASILINHSTKWSFVANDRMEVGGDKAQDFYFEGPIHDKAGGLPLHVTTKNRFVANNEGFIFTEADMLGHNEILNDVEFLNSSEGWMLNMMCYGTWGGALPNTAALARFNTGGTFYGWTTTDVDAAASP